MLTDFAAQVATLVDAVSIDSATSFRWFGERSERLPAKLRASLNPAAARRFLRAELQLRLYADFYTRGHAARTDIGTEPMALPTRRTRFVARLSAENSGRGGWEPGWRVVRRDAGWIVAEKEGLTVLASCEDSRVPPGKGESELCEGSPAELRRPRESLGVAPGYYVAHGDETATPEGSGDVVRLYWNVAPAGAPLLVREITSRLNRARVAFDLKVLADEGRFRRCDAAVLYLNKGDVRRVARDTSEVMRAVEAHLRPDVPALTRRLAPGVGVAEQPPRGVSFGLHRCGLLAEAIVRGHEQDVLDPEETVHLVRRTFASEGLDLARPYLNPGSRDIYRVLEAESRVPAERSFRHVRLGSTRIPAGPLEGAALVAHRFCRDAVWHAGRCTWLGEERPDVGPLEARIGPSLATLGPDLYSGTAGVALFLAEFHAASHDHGARRAAEGAARQAFALIEGRGGLGSGLFTGWAGIGYATARVGFALRSEEWTVRGASLLELGARDLLAGSAAPDPALPSPGSDLVSGRAGSVAALAALTGALGPSLLQRAVELGDDLLRSAVASDEGLSWRADIRPVRRNLTGLSHGAAGIGAALLELFASSGLERFREGAEAAFAYERALFDRRLGGWPDFRSVAASVGPRRAPWPAYWCHGAAGIALTRLRAHEILGGRYLGEAGIGLDATCVRLAEGLANSEEDLSLCHGLLGNAEVLGCGLAQSGKIFGEQPGAWLSSAPSLIDQVRQRALEAVVDLPRLGRPGPQLVDTPGLMLGWSGLGLFLLRLYDPSIPSMLLLRREDYAPC